MLTMYRVNYLRQHLLDHSLSRNLAGFKICSTAIRNTCPGTQDLGEMVFGNDEKSLAATFRVTFYLLVCNCQICRQNRLVLCV
jgi:hypothetical protein